MIKTASFKRVASRYVIASINLPVVEEVFPLTFSQIEPFDRLVICDKITRGLGALSSLEPQAVCLTLSAITQVGDTYIDTDVAHLFSDMGAYKLENLISAIY